eukprot:m.174686 g.174686  ORF g.174686 m.174686 type:complete len:184 (+) comp18332_c0_seq1:180-731(+)
MLKLFSLKEKKDAGEEVEISGTKQNKVSAAQLRVQKDHSDLQLPSSCTLEFEDADDLLNFTLIMKPEEGMYKGGKFVFSFKVSGGYPHEAPKVHCDTKIYHPNIDLDGNICLNVLREDWKPVLNLQTIVYGLVFLFLEPNMDDPLNKEAAEVMKRDRVKFEKNVRKAMRGEFVEGTQFDRCLA